MIQLVLQFTQDYCNTLLAIAQIILLKGGWFGIFSFYVRYSTLLHMPSLCVGECWDRTQDSCDYTALAVRRSKVWSITADAGKRKGMSRGERGRRWQCWGLPPPAWYCAACLALPSGCPEAGDINTCCPWLGLVWTSGDEPIWNRCAASLPRPGECNRCTAAAADMISASDLRFSRCMRL